MQKHNKYNCDEIEKLIMFDEINASNEHIVEQHLEMCARCRQFASILENIQAEMTHSQGKVLQPSPRIRQKIIKQMKKKRRANQSTVSGILIRLKSLFEYRVPVYQAALTIVTLLLIILLVKQSPSPVQLNTDKQFRIAQQDTLNYRLFNLNIIENIDDISNQNIGQSSVEDSIFSRYIFSSM
jgi:hypothetical protein